MQAVWYLEAAQTLMGYALLAEQTVQKMHGSGDAVLSCRPTTKYYSEILHTFESGSV